MSVWEGASRSFKKASAGLFPLLVAGPLVGLYCSRTVARDLHDNLLINIILIELCGCSGSQGVVGVVAWKASEPTHVTHGHAKSIDTSRSVHIPCLSKIFLTGL